MHQVDHTVSKSCLYCNSEVHDTYKTVQDTVLRSLVVVYDVEYAIRFLGVPIGESSELHRRKAIRPLLGCVRIRRPPRHQSRGL